MKWHPINSEEYHMELGDPPDADFESGWTAHVKWDGCVNLLRKFNAGYPSEDVDTIHICDLDDVIARLQEIRDLAKKHFGADWPKCWLIPGSSNGRTTASEAARCRFDPCPRNRHGRSTAGHRILIPITKVRLLPVVPHNSRLEFEVLN